MPLVVPGITPQSGQASTNSQNDWLNKLAGKKLGDKHDETVRVTPKYSPSSLLSSIAHTLTVQNFAKQDLPKNHQIVEPGSFNTMDHNKDRLKVHVGDDGIVRDVSFG
ncbi:hypothetical protein MMC30_005587 [Trapelia coarctata]|nr:hypothetical protein [Trapelia coarctata]